MKILTVVGARPQFIKAMAVSRAIAEQRKIREKILHTGQHYDENMSDIFFRQLRIPRPYKNLNVGSRTHGAQTAEIMTGVERECIREKPDLLLVYGDTNSTVAAALAAAKLLIPVAHVEAGLRSFNRRMPEELNRILSDRASSLLFAPSKTAVMNLKKEGMTAGVHNVGDVMVDSVRLFMNFDRKKSQRPRPYFCLTLHRQENTDDPTRLRGIFASLSESPYPIEFKVHPRTRITLKRQKIKIPSVVHLSPPVGYVEMIELQKNSLAVFTDSGGIQKEAAILGRPCYTLRDDTEWVETVNSGWNRLLGADAKKIAAVFRSKDWEKRRDPFPVSKFYGDGHASERIAKILCQ